MKTTFIFLVFIIFFLEWQPALCQEPHYESVGTVKIDLSEFKDKAYGSAATKQDKQPFFNDQSAFSFLSAIAPSIQPKTSSFGLSKFLDYATQKDKAIIFVTHPIDLNLAFSQLDKSNIDKQQKLGEAFSANITTISGLESFATNIKDLKGKIEAAISNSVITEPLSAENIDILLKSYANIQSQSTALQNQMKLLKRQGGTANLEHARLLDLSLTKINGVKGTLLDLINKDDYTSSLSLKEQTEFAAMYSSIQQAEVSVRNQISELKVENSGLKKNYEDLCNRYSESSAVSSFLLHQSDKRSIGSFFNEQYLSDVRDILIVCVGGSQDLAQMTVEIVKKTDSFTSSINSAIEVVNSLTGVNISSGVGQAVESVSSLSCPSEEVQVPITFIRLVNDREIKPPYDLKLKIPKQENDLTYTSHELNSFLITFGFSSKWVSPTLFANIGNSKVQVQKSDFLDGFKADAYILLDWSPFKRDIDRLTEKKVAKATDRWSITGGVKVSKDPLQSLLAGFAYAFNSSTRLIFGFAYNRVPTINSIIDVGNVGASVKYLQDNVDREYKPGFYFGLSLSPGSVLKIIK